MSTGKKSNKNDKIPTWDDAIRLAEEHIAQAQRRIAAAEGSLKLFRERKAAGEPFPGTESLSVAG